MIIMTPVTVSTKCWEGDWQTVLERIKGGQRVDQVVGNNLKDPRTVQQAFLELGIPFYLAEEYEPDVLHAFGVTLTDVERCYSISELVEIYLTNGLLVHYASDVIPPPDQWIVDAAPLLHQFTVVSPTWLAAGDPTPRGVEFWPFGFTDHSFSDHAYIVDANRFKRLDYNTYHPIGDNFPEHGGNSFERRVAMYLANNGLWRAVLSKYYYKHIDRSEK